MNRKRTPQVIFTVLVCAAPIIAVEFMRRLPPTSPMREFDLTIAIILTLVVGSVLLYTYANRPDNSANWWKDDDWSQWGGI
jgi:multisubunit Na+/H+ antiporter MnhB subunit